MNKSRIKFLGIFLILLFCLSPLGAIDLGQGDNSIQINDNNGTVIADDADSDDNDMEIISDNETDDKKAIAYDVELQNVSVNYSNSTKNLQSHDPKMSMEVENCVYGESPIVKIYINSDFGYAYDQKVYIYGDHYWDVYTATFKEKCNVIKLRNDIPPGSYNITYQFRGSSYYKDVDLYGKLEVYKRDANIECSVEDVDYGQMPQVKLHTEEGLKEPYGYITSPQFSKEYKFDASKANNEVSIDENLPTGKYTCNVFYPGDKFHNSQNTTLTFNVNKLNPHLTVKTKDIVKGGNLYVEVHANETITDDVACTIRPAFSSSSSSSIKPDLPSQTIHLVNGVGYATINCYNLSPGKYFICTGYSGDDIFKGDIVFTNFKVKSDPKLSVKVNDSYYGEHPKVEILADNKLNGKVHVDLLKTNYSYDVDVVNGSGVVEAHELDKGTYTAVATFAGDDSFVSTEKSTNFTVKPHNPNLAIKVNNVTASENVTVEVTANKSMNGLVYVFTNRTRSEAFIPHVIHVENGYGSMQISDFTAGDYYATVIYEGSPMFDGDIKTANFTVKEDNANLSLHVDDIVYGENATVKVNAYKLFNGDVKVNLISESVNKTVLVNVKDGVGEVSVANLTTGTYSADAIFDGDDTFKPSNASTSFKVGLADPNMSMSADSCGFSSELVTIHTKESFSGDVQVKIKSQNDYKEATVKVVNGVGETIFGGLTPFDTYNATATFDGDKLFKPGSANASFKVNGRL